MRHMKTHNSRQRGAVSGSTVVISILALLLVAMGGLAVWSYMNYYEANTDLEGKLTVARAEAAKQQAEEDELKFREFEKEPNRQFVGPDDYGRVSFDYPKNWSVYVARDASKGGAYQAYLNPVLVPAIKESERYALRVLIEDKDYESAVDRYRGQVSSGRLKSSAISVNGVNGTRLDGNITSDIRGSIVLFKIRDKVLTVRTDAETFKGDFDKLVETIEFEQ